MTYTIGSAVNIKTEVDVVQGTIAYVQSLKDPNGNVILENQIMAFDTEDTDEAFFSWQSIKGTHPEGKYKFIIRVQNGIYSDVQKGNFYIEGE